MISGVSRIYTKKFCDENIRETKGGKQRTSQKVAHFWSDGKSCPSNRYCSKLNWRIKCQINLFLKKHRLRVREEKFEAKSAVSIFGAPVSWVALFGALIGALSLVPFLFYVNGGGFMSAGMGIFGPLAGVMLGPFAGFVAGAIGGVIGMFISPAAYPLGFVDVFSGSPDAITLGNDPAQVLQVAAGPIPAQCTGDVAYSIPLPWCSRRLQPYARTNIFLGHQLGMGRIDCLLGRGRKLVSGGCTNPRTEQGTSSVWF